MALEEQLINPIERSLLTDLVGLYTCDLKTEKHLRGLSSNGTETYAKLLGNPQSLISRPFLSQRKFSKLSRRRLILRMHSRRVCEKRKT